MRFVLRTLASLLALAALALAAATDSPPAPSHRDPCHLRHDCPSDHHTYPWKGLWCTSYRDERLPSDSKVVVYNGRSYWCHGSGSGGVPERSRGTAACGVERWSVKTLQDRPRLLPL